MSLRFGVANSELPSLLGYLMTDLEALVREAWCVEREGMEKYSLIVRRIVN